jgi:hypothetical protein
MLLGLAKLDGLDEWRLCMPKDMQSLSQEPKGRGYLKFQDVVWKIVIKLTLNEYTGRMRLKFVLLGIGASVDFCKKRGNSRLSEVIVMYFLNMDFDLLVSLFNY